MNDLESKIIEIPLTIQEEDVWRVMGAKDRIAKELKDEAAFAIKEISRLSDSKAIVKRFKISSVTSKGIKFETGEELVNKFASHLFKGAEEAFFIISTIGSEVDKRISELMIKGENILAIILDSAGTAAAFNSFTYILDKLLEETTSRDLKMGTCLRPGQSYWDITGQTLIFNMLEAKKIDVELLSSSFMKPQKSQSGIVPIGSNLLIQEDPSESYCKYCKASRCPMRIEPYQELKA